MRPVNQGAAVTRSRLGQTAGTCSHRQRPPAKFAALKLESLIDQIGQQADEQQLDARENDDDAEEAQMPSASDSRSRL